MAPCARAAAADRSVAVVWLQARVRAPSGDGRAAVGRRDRRDVRRGRVPRPVGRRGATMGPCGRRAPLCREPHAARAACAARRMCCVQHAPSRNREPHASRERDVGPGRVCCPCLAATSASFVRPRLALLRAGPAVRGAACRRTPRAPPRRQADEMGREQPMEWGSASRLWPLCVVGGVSECLCRAPEVDDADVARAAAHDVDRRAARVSVQGRVQVAAPLVLLGSRRLERAEADLDVVVVLVARRDEAQRRFAFFEAEPRVLLGVRVGDDTVAQRLRVPRRRAREHSVLLWVVDVREGDDPPAEVHRDFTTQPVWVVAIREPGDDVAHISAVPAHGHDVVHLAEAALAHDHEEPRRIYVPLDVEDVKVALRLCEAPMRVLQRRGATTVRRFARLDRRAPAELRRVYKKPQRGGQGAVAGSEVLDVDAVVLRGPDVFQLLERLRVGCHDTVALLMKAHLPQIRRRGKAAVPRDVVDRATQLPLRRCGAREAQVELDAVDAARAAVARVLAVWRLRRGGAEVVVVEHRVTTPPLDLGAELGFPGTCLGDGFLRLAAFQRT
mmetsp:Transcript_10705/g.37721  ORF Transcript_10705/g.37721 Transcript_10705/m.37721 type:complete len:559 (-) Transcript_10705:79-1755(-)